MKKIKVGPYIVIIGVFTLTGQVALHLLINSVNALGILAQVSIFVLGMMTVYIDTSNRAFEQGLMASKDHSNMQKVVAGQVKQALSMVETEKKKLVAERPAQVSNTSTFDDLEITGV